MKCMNPKCDSKEFSLITRVSLTNGDMADDIIDIAVSCDDCGLMGPECETEVEAKSYFEEKGPVKSYPGGKMTVHHPIAEYAEKMRLLTPAIIHDEMSDDFDSHDYNAWYDEFLLEIAPKKNIPREVLKMEFDSGFSAAKSALKILDMIRRYEDATTGGRRLYEAFLNELYHPKEQKQENLKPGEVWFYSNDPVIERETDPPSFFAECFGGKRLGIPFDMSKEREIEIMKPLTPGPTQITDSPVPEITAPTINMANYTNKCDCGAAAYRGATALECTDRNCRHWVKPKP